MDLPVGHLRRRLPQEFQWVTETNQPDDDSDVFSSSYPPSHNGLSSTQRGSGCHSPRGNRPTVGGGGSGPGGLGRNAPTGGKRKQPEEGTDCMVMVKEWREQNI